MKTSQKKSYNDTSLTQTLLEGLRTRAVSTSDQMDYRLDSESQRCWGYWKTGQAIKAWVRKSMRGVTLRL